MDELIGMPDSVTWIDDHVNDRFRLVRHENETWSVVFVDLENTVHTETDVMDEVRDKVFTDREEAEAYRIFFGRLYNVWDIYQAFCQNPTEWEYEKACRAAGVRYYSENALLGSWGVRHAKPYGHQGPMKNPDMAIIQAFARRRLAVALGEYLEKRATRAERRRAAKAAQRGKAKDQN